MEGETLTQTQDPLQTTGEVAGQASGTKAGSTSPQTTKTYPEEEVTKRVSDALAQQGRQHKVILEAVTAERDTLKTQISQKETALAAIQSERDTLQSQIDNLTKDDPNKFDLIKRDKDLRAKEKKITDDLNTLENEKKTHADVLSRAESIDREARIIDVSMEYENPEPARLSELCSQLGFKTEEQIRKMADALWTKKPVASAVAPAPGLKPFPGSTTGGNVDLSKLSPDEKIKVGLQNQKNKK